MHGQRDHHRARNPAMGTDGPRSPTKDRIKKAGRADLFLDPACRANQRHSETRGNIYVERVIILRPLSSSLRDLKKAFFRAASLQARHKNYEIIGG